MRLQLFSWTQWISLKTELLFFIISLILDFFFFRWFSWDRYIGVPTVTFHTREPEHLIRVHGVHLTLIFESRKSRTRTLSSGLKNRLFVRRSKLDLYLFRFFSEASVAVGRKRCGTVLNCLFKKSSAGIAFIVEWGVDQYRKRSLEGLSDTFRPSLTAFFKAFLTVSTYFSAKPFDCGWSGAKRMWRYSVIETAYGRLIWVYAKYRNNFNTSEYV